MSRIFFIFIIFFVSSCSTNNKTINFSSANNNHLEKTLSEYSDEEVCAKAQFKTNSNLTVWDTYDNLEYVREARDIRGLLCDVDPPSLPKRQTDYINNTSENFTNTSYNRVALLVGNSKYKYMPSLNNPANDVNRLEETLKEFGFEVTKETNLNFEQLRDVIINFNNNLNSYGDIDVIFFYYAGHGLQNNGVNFIAPIDAKINSADDIKYEMQNTDEMFTNIAEASKNAIKIFLLDACRENIFRNSKYKQSNISLSINNKWDNSIIGFSTIEGQKSRDGNGENSPYIEELINSIKSAKDNQIENVLKETRKKVIEKTKNEQRPVEMSNLTGSFTF